MFSPSSFPSFLLDDAFKKRVVVVAFVFALFPTRCSRHVDEEEEEEEVHEEEEERDAVLVNKREGEEEAMKA